MTNQLTIKTLVIATMLLMLVDSSIAIGLFVGVTVLSVGVFGAIAYAVASRKTKDKDSKYGHQYPVSSHGIFPGRICLEVVTLKTKITEISNTYGTNRTNCMQFVLLVPYVLLIGKLRHGPQFALICSLQK